MVDNKHQATSSGRRLEAIVDQAYSKPTPSRSACKKRDSVQKESRLVRSYLFILSHPTMFGARYGLMEPAAISLIMLASREFLRIQNDLYVT